MSSGARGESLCVCGSMQSLGARVARSKWERMLGILLVEKPHSQGIIIYPCRWIHTFTLLAPIDVFFFDDKGIIVSKAIGLSPRRFINGPDKAKFALEIYTSHNKLTEWGVSMILHNDTMIAIKSNATELTCKLSTH